MQSTVTAITGATLLNALYDQKLLPDLCQHIIIEMHYENPTVIYSKDADGNVDKFVVSDRSMSYFVDMLVHTGIIVGRTRHIIIDAHWHNVVMVYREELGTNLLSDFQWPFDKLELIEKLDEMPAASDLLDKRRYEDKIEQCDEGYDKAVYIPHMKRVHWKHIE